MGLGCAALTNHKAFPTYPNPLTAEQNGAGLSSPATAIALLGTGGAGLMLLLLFMAVTSSTSAELIAVSSLLTFDIYKTYIRPNATSRELVRVSHYSIAIYALVLAVICCIFNVVNVNLTWLLTILGIIVGGASIPSGLMLLWPRVSTTAVQFAPWFGLSFGLTAWFVTTSKRSGSITVLTTGNPINAVAGNIASSAGGAIVAVVLTLLFPKKFTTNDPEHVARNNKINGILPPAEKELHTTSSPTGTSKEPHSTAVPETLVPTGNEVVDFLEAKQIEPMDPELVRKGERLATIAIAFFFVVAIVLVPFTFFGTQYIFSKAAFTGWIVVSFIWVWVSMIICVVWPVVESMGALRDITKGIMTDLTGKGGARKGVVGDVEGGGRSDVT